MVAVAFRSSIALERVKGTPVDLRGNLVGASWWVHAFSSTAVRDELRLWLGELAMTKMRSESNDCGEEHKDDSVSLNNNDFDASEPEGI